MKCPNGRTYQKLPSDFRGGIDRRYLSATIIMYENIEKSNIEIIRIIHERLNNVGK